MKIERKDQPISYAQKMKSEVFKDNLLGANVIYLV